MLICICTAEWLIIVTLSLSLSCRKFAKNSITLPLFFSSVVFKKKFKIYAHCISQNFSCLFLIIENLQTSLYETDSPSLLNGTDLANLSKLRFCICLYYK